MTSMPSFPFESIHDSEAGSVVLGNILICWGTRQLATPKNPESQHVREFEFVFGKRFAQRPALSTDIRTHKGRSGAEASAFCVYSHDLTERGYSGSLIEIDKNACPFQVEISYIAIGQIAS